jgi:hypothetical protein
MHHVVIEFAARFLILWIPFFIAAPAFAQEPESGSQEVVSPAEQMAPAPAATAPANTVQNAVLEGIQVSSEPSKDPKAIVVTCYFIFHDKPSSYFYETKRKTNKLIFEFNDAQKGTSPIPSQKVSPIQGFQLEERKVDVNKDVKGLKPELHDQLYVTFNLDAIPKIHVADEYNVISYTFTWSTDPAKVKTLVDNTGKTNWGLVGGLAGGGAVAVGAVLYILLRPKPPVPPASPLDTSDLPSRSQLIRW